MVHPVVACRVREVYGVGRDGVLRFCRAKHSGRCIRRVLAADVLAVYLIAGQGAVVDADFVDGTVKRV